MILIELWSGKDKHFLKGKITTFYEGDTRKLVLVLRSWLSVLSYLDLAAVERQFFCPMNDKVLKLHI